MQEKGRRSKGLQPRWGCEKLSWTLAAVTALALIGGWWWFRQETGPSGDDPLAGAPDPLTEGKALYVATCASCHGITGEGQPNWRTPNDQGVFPAPPHDDDGHTWHHSDLLLLDISARGGNLPNSGMPGFADKLTQLQMEAVLAHIKTFWGADQLEFQTEVTQAWEAQSP